MGFDLFDGIMLWDIGHDVKSGASYSLTMGKFTGLMEKETPLLYKQISFATGDDMRIFLSLRNIGIIKKHGFFSPYYYVDEQNLGNMKEFKEKWHKYQKDSVFDKYDDNTLAELYNFLARRAKDQKPYVLENIEKNNKTIKYKTGGKRRLKKKTHKR